MRLVYLPANAAWTITLGDSLIRWRDLPLFWHSRKALTDAITADGATVSPNGEIL